MDESLLSDGGRDERGGGGGGGGGGQQTAGQSSTQQQPSRTSGYPWVQMALPGGGIVSVPLETTSVSGSGGRGVGVGGGGVGERVTSPSSSIDSSGGQLGGGGCGGQLLQGLPAPPPPAAASGDVSSVGGASDLLAAPPPPPGDPVTHFNLDQLLEIVQSFQLDATLAGNEEAPHLNLASAEGAVANIVKVSRGRDRQRRARYDELRKILSVHFYFPSKACSLQECLPFASLNMRQPATDCVVLREAQPFHLQRTHITSASPSYAGTQ